jgi:hypothetical protein
MMVLPLTQRLPPTKRAWITVLISDRAFFWMTVAL